MNRFFGSIFKNKMTQRTKGVVCIIFAAFGFSMMSVFVKLSGDNLPFMQKAFFRNFIALIFVSVIMAKNKIPLMPEKRNIPLLLGRSIFGTIGLTFNFYAIDRLVLADANMLNKLSPFFAIIFSVILLKEKPNLIQVGGVTLAALGSVCIIKPGFDNPEIFPSIVGLIGGMGAGIAYTFVRKLGMRQENGSRIIFCFSLFSCLVCVPFMIADFVPMTASQVFFLILAGLSACIGQFGITKAYLFAPAKEISVYDYTQVIFAAVFGFFFFGQIPDACSFLGYLLICGAGIGMFFYNKR